MPYTKWAAVATLTGALALNSISFAATPAATRASAFCVKLQPTLQPFLKIPLALFSADDSSTDNMHAGESQYVHCQFRQTDGSMVDIGLHDDADGLFDDASKNGYAALTGYADKGRYTTRGAAGQKWIDVVRGKVACEARFALDDNGNPLNRDWKEVGGRICLAAFALH
jgi:hypothetical protein